MTASLDLALVHLQLVKGTTDRKSHNCRLVGEGRNPAFRNTQYSQEESLEIALLLGEESHMHYIHKKLQREKKSQAISRVMGPAVLLHFS